MKRSWSVALAAFVLPLFTGVVAEAVPATDCVAGSITVTSPGNGPGEIPPSAVQDGYNNNTCNLTILTSITPIDSSITFNAKSITVQGPSVAANPPGASPNVLIVNTLADSSVLLQAIDLIKIDQGSIKATNLVRLTCNGADCPITVTGSELMATETVTTAPGGGFGGPNGTLQVTADGNFSITTSSFTGGALVKFTSVDGSLTIICAGGGVGACKDPTIPPFLSQTIAAKCGNPPVFPCNLGMLSEAEIKNICIPDIGDVVCDGGSKEKDFIAENEINLVNSTMTTDRHMVIKSDFGPIRAMGFDLTAGGALTMSINNCQGVERCIDLRNAILDVAGPIQLRVNGGCPTPPVISIDLKGAVVKGLPGPLPIGGVAANACNGAGLIVSGP